MLMPEEQPLAAWARSWISISVGLRISVFIAGSQCTDSLKAVNYMTRFEETMETMWEMA